MNNQKVVVYKEVKNMDNELDLLNKEVKERVIELEEQMRKHYTEEEWFNYLTIKNEFEKN